MLTDRIRLSGPEDCEPEDFFYSALAVIFPDNIINQHGDAQTSVIYLSPRFGNVPLALADPQGEDARRLFSHFLWNASLQLAQFIEDEGEGQRLGADAETEVDSQHQQDQAQYPWDWSVRDHTVLELGAGTGLAGIMACLAGAREVVLTDYPAPEVLANIEHNVKQNINIPDATSTITTTRVEAVTADTSDEGKAPIQRHPPGTLSVQGHEWGQLDTALCQTRRGTFTRILVADCLWMPWEHAALLASIGCFLAPGGQAWVIAGFHTGRAKMAGFFADEARLTRHGLVVRALWERSAEGTVRPWQVDRGIEDVTERKRWLVIGVLGKLEAGEEAGNP